MKYLPFVLFLLLVSCGESERDHAIKLQQDSMRRYDSLIRTRKEIYEAAIGGIKDRLKAPSTARFPTLSLLNDTVKIAHNAGMAIVEFPYEAQNAMGVYLRGWAYGTAFFKEGKWIIPYVSDFETNDAYTDFSSDSETYFAQQPKAVKK